MSGTRRNVPKEIKNLEKAKDGRDLIKKIQAIMNEMWLHIGTTIAAEELVNNERAEFCEDFHRSHGTPAARAARPARSPRDPAAGPRLGGSWKDF